MKLTLSQLTRQLVADFNNKSDDTVIYDKAPSVWLEVLDRVAAFASLKSNTTLEFYGGILYVSGADDRLIYSIGLEPLPPCIQNHIIDIILPKL